MAVYFITGATGYIGSMLIKYLYRQDDGNKIIAAVRDGKKAEGVLPEGIEVLQVDLSDHGEVKKIELKCDYIIHCASVTKSAEMISRPVEVIESIINTTQNVLELARKCDVRSMVYLSSMEVYGKIDCSGGHRVSEQELGNIDIYNVRSCYPLGKRMAENICHSYFAEYGVPVKIARLAQTFGRGVTPEDSRVFAQFANAVRTGSDIVLHTAGNSMGNYCDIDEVIDAILFLLQNGANSEAYNVVNEKNTMRIREMAELVVKKIAGGSIKVSYDIPSGNHFGYAPDTGLKLSGEKLRRLGWEATCSLEDMYRKMLRDFES